MDVQEKEKREVYTTVAWVLHRSSPIQTIASAEAGAPERSILMLYGIEPGRYEWHRRSHTYILKYFYMHTCLAA